MRKFKINRYIKLKLVNDKTFIFVSGEWFRQCSYLLMNKRADKIKEISALDSVDEMEEKLDTDMESSEGKQFGIPPEAKFWAHSSNLQVWAENQYDTRMLHRNLAFPLLKRLTDVGDPVARRVFKEEIAQRFESGFEPVVKFLIIE